MRRAGLSCSMIVIMFLTVVLMQTAGCKKDTDDIPSPYGSWVDPADGTVYRTLELGDQIWLADNINRGIMINGNTDQKDNDIIEKYCYDNNFVLCEKYGGLYQWGEAMQYSSSESSQGICPSGWHIPSDSEWKILEMHLNMTREDAEDLFWRGTDQGVILQTGGGSGFEALRGGNRFVTGSFQQIGNSGYFWTSTKDEDNHAWRRGVSLQEQGIYRSVNNNSFGFSVRCVRY